MSRIPAINEHGEVEIDSIGELSRSDLRHWIATRLRGEDVLTPGSIREGEPPHFLFVSIYSKLPATAREDFQEVVLEFLKDLVENAVSEWLGDAGKELLMLLDPVLIQSDRREETVDCLLQIANSSRLSRDEKNDLRLRALQCLVAFRHRADRQFWRTQFDRGRERYVSVVLSGLALIDISAVFEWLVGLSWNDHIEEAVIRFLPILLEDYGTPKVAEAIERALPDLPSRGAVALLKFCEQEGITIRRPSLQVRRQVPRVPRPLVISAFEKTAPWVGLDIGSSSIKAVELKVTKVGYEVVSFGMEMLAPATVVDGAILDAPQVANAISKIFDAQHIKTKNVATSVSGSSVIVKRVPLPLMSEDELYDRIPSEASRHIPFDIADVNLSYQLLESMDSQMDVLLVAVKKDKIVNHTNVLAQAGKIPVVDIDAFGLQKCFDVNYEPDAGQTVALLNIGASAMNINIVRGGIPLFTRDVSVGGNEYTGALRKELNLSFEEAERLKKGETLPGVSDEQKQQILSSVSDTLTLEIQKSFDFFNSITRGENIQRIVVAGGTARVPGLVNLLREEFAMPVEEFNPFRRIILDSVREREEEARRLAPQLAIAVGLALRGKSYRGKT